MLSRCTKDATGVYKFYVNLILSPTHGASWTGHANIMRKGPRSFAARRRSKRGESLFHQRLFPMGPAKLHNGGGNWMFLTGPSGALVVELEPILDFIGRLTFNRRGFVIVCFLCRVIPCAFL